MERRALGSDSANVVSGRKLDLNIMLLIGVSQCIRAPYSILVVKATSLRSEGVKGFLP